MPAFLFFVFAHHASQVFARQFLAGCQFFLDGGVDVIRRPVFQFGRQFPVEFLIDDAEVGIEVGIQGDLIIADGGEVIVFEGKAEDLSVDEKLMADRQPGLVLDRCVHLINLEADAEFIGFEGQAVNAPPVFDDEDHSFENILPAAAWYDAYFVHPVAAIEEKAFIFKLVVAESPG